MNERWPHPSVVAKELERIRAEMAQDRWHARERFRRELKATLKFDERYGRPWSVTQFTYQRLIVGERIIRELEQNGRTIIDGRVV